MRSRLLVGDEILMLKIAKPQTDPILGGCHFEQTVQILNRSFIAINGMVPFPTPQGTKMTRQGGPTPGGSTYLKVYLNSSEAQEFLPN